MNAPFDDLIRTVLSDLAKEAASVNLTQRAIGRAHRRRTMKIALSGIAVAGVVLIGTPLALAAVGHVVQPAVPSPSVFSPVPTASAVQPVPTASPVQPVPTASPTASPVQPVPTPSPSPECTPLVFTPLCPPTPTASPTR